MLLQKPERPPRTTTQNKATHSQLEQQQTMNKQQQIHRLRTDSSIVAYLTDKPQILILSSLHD